VQAQKNNRRLPCAITLLHPCPSRKNRREHHPEIRWNWRVHRADLIRRRGFVLDVTTAEIRTRQVQQLAIEAIKQCGAQRANAKRR